jgi:phosphoribosylformylglycinamidine cyclo-ligase
LDLQAANLDIHYLSNITGHGWRKIMRAEEELSYLITDLPPVPEIFRFISEQTKNDSQEMYSNYNMGAGYAIYLPANQVYDVTKIAQRYGFQTWIAGTVEAGPKQVVIQPLDITFSGDSLGVR